MIICVQMMPELRRYIQHISLSPDSINNDDVSTLPLFSFVAALAAGRETPPLYLTLSLMKHLPRPCHLS